MTGADRHSQQTRCVSLAHRRRTAKISGDRRHLQTALENEQAITAIDVGVQFPEQSIYRLEPSGWRQASADRLRVCWCTQAGSRGSGSARWHSPAPRARAELSRFPVQQLQFEPGQSGAGRSGPCLGRGPGTIQTMKAGTAKPATGRQPTVQWCQISG